MARYTPFEDIDRMFEQMRSQFGTWGEMNPDYSGESGRMRGGVHFDLDERDGEFVLIADLPGFEKDEISIRFDDGVLAIAADHEMGDETSARRRRVHERVTLPKTVEEEEIEASYRNGVLEVRLPIVEEERDAGRTIDISD